MEARQPLVVPPDCYSHHALLKLQATLEEAEEKEQLIMHNNSTGGGGGGEGEGGDQTRVKDLSSDLLPHSRVRVDDLHVQPAVGQLSSAPHHLVTARSSLLSLVLMSVLFQLPPLLLILSSHSNIRRGQFPVHSVDESFTAKRGVPVHCRLPNPFRAVVVLPCAVLL